MVAVVGILVAVVVVTGIVSTLVGTAAVRRQRRIAEAHQRARTARLVRAADRRLQQLQQDAVAQLLEIARQGRR